MNNQEFLKLSPEKKVDLVNKMLENESTNHLPNVAKKLGLSPSTFSKIMRNNDMYQYNQSQKQYFRLLSIDKYKEIASHDNNKDGSEDLLQYLHENLESLKLLLEQTNEQVLLLEPEIYDPQSKTVNKTMQINADIYEQFASLCTSKFPHLRLRDLVSKCLFDFVNKHKV